MLIAQRPSQRRGRCGQPQPLRHRAPRARLRLHARQLPASHPALEHPRRVGHQHPRRRRAARVLHGPRGQGGRHRDHPQHQGPRRLLRARRAGRDVPAQAGPRRDHRCRHRPARGCRGAQPRPAHRHAERQGQGRDGADRRARPRLRLRHAEQGRRPGDRPYSGRLHLQPGPRRDLQGRGDACRAAHRLRQAHRRRRDQELDGSPRRDGLRRQDPGRAVRPGP